MKKQVVIGLIAVLVLAAVGGGAFWAGTKAGQKQALQNPASFFQQRARGQDGQFPMEEGTPPAGQRFGQSQAGGGLTGTIEKVEGDTVILTTDEGSVTVKTSDTTLIEKTMSVGTKDLAIGDRVMVSGSKNDDGSYTARSIQTMRAAPSATPAQP